MYSENLLCYICVLYAGVFLYSLAEEADKKAQAAAKAKAAAPAKGCCLYVYVCACACVFFFFGIYCMHMLISARLIVRGRTLVI